MDKIDWSSFTRRINILADKEKVFQYWSSQQKLEEWFLSSANFYASEQLKDYTTQIQVGDTYKWMWHGSDNVAEGEILAATPSELIKFTFLGCHVSVTLHDEGEGMVVELTQSEIPTDEASKLNCYVECTRGWTFYLTNLKSVLEGGLDLRNKDPQQQRVINT